MAKHTLYPGYEVTKEGTVLSFASNWRGYGERELTQNLNWSGYPNVRIYVNGQRRCVAVHKLVAEHFLPPRPTASHEIRHLDGDKLNNNAANLAWGTAKDNADDREQHGRTSRGMSHSAAIKEGINASSNLYWRHAR